jgi:hypothetical protein
MMEKLERQEHPPRVGLGSGGEQATAVLSCNHEVTTLSRSVVSKHVYTGGSPGELKHS